MKKKRVYLLIEAMLEKETKRSKELKVNTEEF